MMFRKISVPVSIKGDLSPSKYVPFGPENTEGGGNDAVSFVTRIPLWSSNTPMIVLVNGFGVINKAPVPGGNVMLIVHEPLVNIELVPKDELVGFHRETIVPVGGLVIVGPPEIVNLLNSSPRVLAPDCNGLLKRLLPVMKTQGT